jgi:hypothetical protein
MVGMAKQSKGCSESSSLSIMSCCCCDLLDGCDAPSLVVRIGNTK